MGRSAKNELQGVLLKRAFFEAPPERVARRLLGKVLTRRTRAGWLAGRIVEVEAYLGAHRSEEHTLNSSHGGISRMPSSA